MARIKKIESKKQDKSPKIIEERLALAVEKTEDTVGKTSTAEITAIKQLKDSVDKYTASNSRVLNTLVGLADKKEQATKNSSDGVSITSIRNTISSNTRSLNQLNKTLSTFNNLEKVLNTLNTSVVSLAEKINKIKTTASKATNNTTNQTQNLRETRTNKASDDKHDKARAVIDKLNAETSSIMNDTATKISKAAEELDYSRKKHIQDLEISQKNFEVGLSNKLLDTVDKIEKIKRDTERHEAWRDDRNYSISQREKGFGRFFRKKVEARNTISNFSPIFNQSSVAAQAYSQSINQNKNNTSSGIDFYVNSDGIASAPNQINVNPTAMSEINAKFIEIQQKVSEQSANQNKDLQEMRLREAQILNLMMSNAINTTKASQELEHKQKTFEQETRLSNKLEEYEDKRRDLELADFKVKMIRNNERQIAWREDREYELQLRKKEIEKRNKEVYKENNLYKAGMDIKSQSGGMASSVAIAALTGGLINPVIAHTLGIDKVIPATLKYFGRSLGNLFTPKEKTPTHSKYGAIAKDTDKNEKLLKSVNNIDKTLVDLASRPTQVKEAKKKEKGILGKLWDGVTGLFGAIGGIGGLLRNSLLAIAPMLVYKLLPNLKTFISDKVSNFFEDKGFSKDTAKGAGDLVSDMLPGAIAGFTLGGFKGALIGAGLSAGTMFIKRKWDEWHDNAEKDATPSKIGPFETATVEAMIGGAAVGSLFGFKGMVIGALVGLAGKKLYDMAEKVGEMAAYAKEHTTSFILEALGIKKPDKNSPFYSGEEGGNVRETSLAEKAVVAGGSVYAYKKAKNLIKTGITPEVKADLDALKAETKEAIKQEKAAAKEKLKNATSRKERLKIKNNSKNAIKDLKTTSKGIEESIKAEAKAARSFTKTGGQALKAGGRVLKAGGKIVGPASALLDAGFDVYSIAASDGPSEVAAKELLEAQKERDWSYWDLINTYGAGQKIAMHLGVDKAAESIVDKIYDFFADSPEERWEKARKEAEKRFKDVDTSKYFNNEKGTSSIINKQIESNTLSIDPVTGGLKVTTSDELMDEIKSIGESITDMVNLPATKITNTINIPNLQSTTDKLNSSTIGVSDAIQQSIDSNGGPVSSVGSAINNILGENIPLISAPDDTIGVSSNENNEISISKGGSANVLSNTNLNVSKVDSTYTGTTQPLHGTQAVKLSDLGLSGTIVDPYGTGSGSNSLPLIAANNAGALQSLDKQLKDWGYDVLYTSAMGGHKANSNHWKGNKVDFQLLKNGKFTKLSSNQEIALAKAGYFSNGAQGWERNSTQKGGGHYDIFLGNATPIEGGTTGFDMFDGSLNIAMGDISGNLTNGANMFMNVLGKLAGNNFNLPTQAMETMSELGNMHMNNMLGSIQTSAANVTNTIKSSVAGDEGLGGIMNDIGNTIETLRIELPQQLAESQAHMPINDFAGFSMPDNGNAVYLYGDSAKTPVLHMS